MDVYKTEEQQIESLRGWWKENGTSVVLGIILGLGAIFGWRAWQAHRIALAESASSLYQEMIAKAHESNAKAAGDTGSRIIEEYPGTGYAVFAALMLARFSVDSGDLDSAAAHLDWAADHNSDPSLGREIRLRSARVRFAQDRYDDALALLDDGDGGEFAGSYDHLRGDIEFRRGNVEAARSAYERALAGARSRGVDAAILESKLDNLGRPSDS